MTTFTWKITQLERELADGYVFTAHYSVDAGSGIQSYGSVRFERPQEQMIPYEELTEEIVINWVKDFSGPEVAAIEAAMQDRIDETLTPTIAEGLPWGTNDYVLLVRARNEDGTYKADDPSTPEVDEAWIQPD